MKAPLRHHEESRQSQISFCYKISSRSLHLYEVEHDLHSRMNNLSCWKRTRKNSGLTRNPILAIAMTGSNDWLTFLKKHITAFHSDSKVRTMWNVEYEIINFVSHIFLIHLPRSKFTFFLFIFLRHMHECTVCWCFRGHNIVFVNKINWNHWLLL